jgi:hypothetical protein
MKTNGALRPVVLAASGAMGFSMLVAVSGDHLVGMIAVACAVGIPGMAVVLRGSGKVRRWTLWGCATASFSALPVLWLAVRMHASAESTLYTLSACLASALVLTALRFLRGTPLWEDDGDANKPG